MIVNEKGSLIALCPFSSSFSSLHNIIMSSFYDLVNSYIRSTETVLVTVDALSVTDTSTPTPQSIETSESWHDRRVLAVISHKDEWALTEEGAYVVPTFLGFTRLNFYADSLYTNLVLQPPHLFTTLMSREYIPSMVNSRSL